jgi:hypothetical protein
MRIADCAVRASGISTEILKYAINTMQKKSWRELGYVPDSEDEGEPIEVVRGTSITECRDPSPVVGVGNANTQNNEDVRLNFLRELDC